MNSISSTESSLMETKDEQQTNHNQVLVLDDPTLLQKQPNLPNEFLWPNTDLVQSQNALQEPIIDLESFLNGDEPATSKTIELVRTACLSHGVFQVTKHGVDSGLIKAAYEVSDLIFKLPLEEKLKAQRKPGSVYGYSGAHADRYSSKLMWKETFSFAFSFGNGYVDNQDSQSNVVNQFSTSFGKEFEHAGWVYKRYCEAMKEVSLVIFELLAMSLGLDRLEFRKFFEDGSSITRCNYYPPCNKPNQTFGTGPHCDPTSLTILHQDQVGGLQVFTDNKWQAILPRTDALVINIGDTFMALTNGKFKSCMHRAIVNKEKERRSLVFFVCPREDKIVRPPPQLISSSRRKYPDFTWFDLLTFTQNHYRADVATLHSFFSWLPSSNSNPK